MEETCLFCQIFSEEYRTLFATRHFFVIFDAFPVGRGHMLIISKRHVKDVFGLELDEWDDLLRAFFRAKRYLAEKFNPDGYNMGINCGETAGQTVFHLHIHIIPRYKGDVKNPRGGIRNFKKPLAKY